MDKNKINNIAELLPEGITEETVTEIAQVMQGLIEERVQEEVSELTDKVFAYLSMKREQIKEAALNELHEESQTHKDAQKFRELLGYMAIEHRPDYIDAESTKRLSKASELVEDNEILAQELSSSLKEQERQSKTIQLLESKLTKKDGEMSRLEESIKTLEDDKEAMLFESTEQAQVITNNVDDEVEEKQLENIGNQFLTEEMLKLMK